MLSKNLKVYLDSKSIDYEIIPHMPAYTASETAQAARICGKNLAKVVVIKLNDKLAMLVLPAHMKIDFDSVKKSTGAQSASIAHEYEFVGKFPDCELGAMPPFGDLYQMDVYLADNLAHKQWLAFNGGNHTDLIKMSCHDFLSLVHPKEIHAC